MNEDFFLQKRYVEIRSDATVAEVIKVLARHAVVEHEAAKVCFCDGP